MTFVRKLLDFSTRYPIVRGMVSYAIIMPTGCIIHQKIERRQELDYARVGRFCLWGSCFTAPTMYAWMKIARCIWPQNTLSVAVTKAVVEQFTFGPFAMCSFFFGMSLLEGKSVEKAKEEVAIKLFPTWKVGALIWPIFQTINYAWIPERNRVPFVSFCSILWSTFLAYMKHIDSSRFKPIAIDGKT